MARSEYKVKQTYTGNGSKSVYSYDFKIEEKKQLLVIETDENGSELNRVRGTDTSTFISSVDGVGEEDGGEITLQSNLDNNHTLYVCLANDEPTQPTEYKNKGSFSLNSFENALDWIGGAVQRAIFLGLRSVRLDEIIDSSNFDPTLPKDIVGEKEKVIKTNSNGDGFSMGPSADDIANAETFSEAAADAQTAAEAAQAAAESAQATAEALFDWTTHNVTDGQSATELSGVTIDFDDHSSKVWEVEIIRGTTVISNGRVAIQNLNGTGRVVLGLFVSNEAHGVTFGINQSGTVCTLTAALDSGAGNGKIKLSDRSRPPA